MVALSMADGYARLTGQPQCVIVHVDVGTQGLGAAVHNASCGRAPVLIFAGLSPFTIEGVGDLIFFKDSEGNIAGAMQYVAGSTPGERP